MGSESVYLQFEASLELPFIDRVGDILDSLTLFIMAMLALLWLLVGVPLRTSGIAVASG